MLATQNPLEMEGTYPLPEAQLDRFFFKLDVPFPSREDLHSILDRTTSDHKAEPKPVLSRQEILDMQELVRKVPVARHVQDYAIRVLQATHSDGEGAPKSVTRYVRTGASPRGVQAMLLAAKVRALFEGASRRRWMTSRPQRGPRSVIASCSASRVKPTASAPTA